MQFDLYVPRQSWLHQLDPRTKLLLTLAGLILCLLFQEPPVLAGILLGYHLLLLTAGIRWEQLRWLWARMLPLTVMILLLQPFFASAAGEPVIWQVGPLRWTVGGILSAVTFAIRVNGMAFAAAGLLYTTEPTRMVRGLVRLGLPFEWGVTVSLAIRYLPTTYGLYQSIHEAQQVRGWDPGRGNPLRRVRNYLPTLVAVMIAALRMADNLGMALAARGFGAPREVPRTTLRDIRLRTADWLVMAGVLLVLTGTLAWRYASG
jgi:energy-coupling factor transport system permease protein